MKKEILVCLIIIILLVGCMPKVIDTGSSNESIYVDRYVDREAGVVCWLITKSYGVAIDCLPVEQTLLQVGR